MVADLIVVVVVALGLTLLRGEGLGQSWHLVTGVFQFLGGLFTTRAGWLLMLFALSSMLHTGARVSELGLAAFDPEVASGARDEQEVCHRFQENLHAGSPPLDGPVRCPAGGGRYEVTLTPTVTITCPRHGSSR